MDMPESASMPDLRLSGRPVRFSSRWTGCRDDAVLLPSEKASANFACAVTSELRSYIRCSCVRERALGLWFSGCPASMGSGGLKPTRLLLECSLAAVVDGAL
jgi:hypothetical protein